ncbi:MAG: hypothetical protein CME65_05970 [Halobacteriovoraceae bacterium]|nr:hypothetical protein [Halobacteriovoraceae bacterium]|tara:strand:+ start:21394 stop:23331 length:1938 start_codon:yes stop_codon:yes gene_type:complete
MIERNIIFIHPLSQRLKELKDEIEKDEEILIYEIDSLNEYGQVVGVLEHSISFSSDLKKTRSYLEDYSQLVKNRESRNILIQENAIAPHIFSKLQALGLNEVLKEKIELKSLVHKVDLFFKSFENSEESSMMQSMAISANKSGLDESFKVKSHDPGRKSEGLFNFDNKKKKKIPSFDHSQFSNFTLKRNKTDLSFLDNPFSHYQRKAVGQFNPELPDRNLKRAKFTPVENEMKKNPYTSSLEVTPSRARRKLNLDLPQNEFKRKPGKLNLPFLDLSKKKGLRFEPVQRESKNRGKFNEVEGKKKPKLNALDGPLDFAPSKRKKFDEVERESKKRDSLEEAGRESKKRERFNEVERELKPREKIEKEEKDLSKLKGKFEEVIAEVDKKKGMTLSEPKKGGRSRNFEEESTGNLVGSITQSDEKEKIGNTTEAILDEVNDENEILLKYHKDINLGPETVLDYKKLKAEFKSGKLKASKDLEEKIIKRSCDEIALIEDSPLFDYSSHGLEYFVTYNDLIWSASSEPQKLLKFVHFSVLKEFEGEIIFYKKNGQDYENIYSGLNKLAEEFEIFEQENKSRWDSCLLPTWQDETFQSNPLEFTFPYFEEGESLGYCVARFPGTVKSHKDAQKIELLVMMAKGVFLEDRLL